MNEQEKINRMIILLSILNIPFMIFSLLVLIESLISNAPVLHILLTAVLFMGLATTYYLVIQNNRVAMYFNIVFLFVTSIIYLIDGWKEIGNWVESYF